ncbi:hypothetical protein C8C77_10252 [Halanaerobium saccharolyticum]|uniref:Flagellar assembly protein T N-terminal domain-containing protein n=2 Tax=Halanaerobium saccharolyticum TaxID=43595 RepID=A0A4R7Z7Z0_9FIRM|nr:flagellar assembly protein T N-terminal domain-containing protein [Halanaerobium saccharolyticum]RAK08605.1 hypothetical protein C7958_10942 [Halanaerobium saccharolyticum]TDW07252.1 hypothetical protein C8C77_10252 [Halanaerobium saccharolyticum]TDX60157.1 hypothetical protein C7956_11042 [Halanaerobium saccharolyticum]
MIILILIIVISPLTRAEEVTVSTEADITAGAELARREALQNAFLEAVQKAAGNYINKSILVENSQLISRRIFSKAEGYVSSYQILEESAAEGIYQLKIKAEVTSKLFSDLEELKMIIKTQTSNPRILLLMDDAQIETLTRTSVNEFQAEVAAIERSLGAISGVNPNAARIQQFLKNELQQLGFELAAGDIENIFLNSLGSSEQWQQNAPKLLTSSKRKWPFELLITGKHDSVRLGEKEFSFGPLIIQGVESSFSVYSAQTGEKLKEIKFTEKAYAEDPNRALEIAVEKVGSSGAVRLTEELMPLINLNSGQKSLKLKVNNLASYGDLTSLEKVIKKLEGIKSFKLHSFADNSASYILNVMQSTDVLAERFNNEEEFPLKIMELGPDYLELTANL